MGAVYTKTLIVSAFRVSVCDSFLKLIKDFPMYSSICMITMFFEVLFLLFFCFNFFLFFLVLIFKIKKIFLNY